MKRVKMNIQKLNQHIAQGKTEILTDIQNGTVPAGIKTFDELHDFVDANEYAGLTSIIDQFANIEEFYEFGNAVQSALDSWLQNLASSQAVSA